MKKLISISILLTCFLTANAQSGVITVKKKKRDELQLIMREPTRYGLSMNCYINERRFPMHMLIGSGYRGNGWTATAGVSLLNRTQVHSVNLRWEYQTRVKSHMVFAGYQYAMLKPGRKITPHSVLSVGLDVGTRLSGTAYLEFKPYLAYSVRAYSSLLNRFQLNLGYALQTGRQTENLSISNGPELALWFYL
ncbi:MAG: hypothetical protein EP332_03880 [Bacteroidetes bacterium]|nr:MAG: hypothetical protein EP332_03880 [Bacteroidota bacterium]